MKTDQPGYDIEIETEGGAPANHAAPQQAASPRQGDDRSNRIERQHSQEMAIRTVSLLMTNGLISTAEEMKTKLKELTDYYQRDVGRTASATTATQPEPDPAGDEVY